MYGRSSINSVGGGSSGDGARRDKGGSSRAQSLISSIGGCDSSPSSSSVSSSSVETGPRSSRDVRRSISSNNNDNNNSSCSSVDSRFLKNPRSLGPSQLYDQDILKSRASVLSQLSSVFGQRINNGRSNSLVAVKQVKKDGQLP